MSKNLNTKEKSCMFCVSDYHFEMMSLPYISKKLEENEKILILTEEDLGNTINMLLEKTNLSSEKKEKILQINWNKNNENKLEDIKKEENRRIEIFIKGKEDYINKMNNKIEEIGNNNIKIIDCYNIEEINDHMDSILIRYNSLINTTGEKRV